MGLSGLNAHRKKYHFIQFGTCPNCNHRSEDPVHYFFKCPLYAAQRAEMITSLRQCIPDIDRYIGRSEKNLTSIILNGTGVEEVDIKIFDIVAVFIRESNRFI